MITVFGKNLNCETCTEILDISERERESSANSQRRRNPY